MKSDNSCISSRIVCFGTIQYGAGVFPVEMVQDVFSVCKTVGQLLSHVATVFTLPQAICNCSFYNIVYSDTPPHTHTHTHTHAHTHLSCPVVKLPLNYHVSP